MITLNNDWDDILKEEFEKDYYKSLRRFLTEEYKTQEIYPKIDDIFNALKYTSYRDTRVVILGQDPYINPGEAHGMAFSVQPGARIPPSLLNIFKELNNDLSCNIPNNGCLIPWANQGVLLLNAVLTVRKGNSRSHAKKGWETFTDRIIELLAKKEKSIVFMLWGKDAQLKMPIIISNEYNVRHLILTSAHPSPLAGNRFMNNKHFSQANQFLKENGYPIINWQIPDIES